MIWGSRWDPLIAKDRKGILLDRMERAVDGDYQNYKARGGAYVREHFFGTHPELLEMVANMTDDDIWRLNRGGHDPRKIYAAYAAAVEHTGQPTVILAKTVKGYGMGEAGEGKNITHQQKKMGDDGAQGVPGSLPDSGLRRRAPRHALSTSPPRTVRRCATCTSAERLSAATCPRGARMTGAARDPGKRDLPDPADGLRGSRDLHHHGLRSDADCSLTRDKKIGRFVVPIVPDEARTFGMEGLFRQLGIYASEGQLYEPVDSDQVMYYREDQSGQILQEGSTKPAPRPRGSPRAPPTPTTESDDPLLHLLLDVRLPTRGRPALGRRRLPGAGLPDRRHRGAHTLAGEGLQHQDGHSHLMASTIPNCVAYDPAYAYELAVIVHDGCAACTPSGRTSSSISPS